MRRNREPVEPYRPDRQGLDRVLHVASDNNPVFRKSLSNCRTRRGKSSPSGYTSKTRSNPRRKRGLIIRYASLLKRLERFRSTALPYFRAKVNAIRFPSVPLARAKSFAPGQEAFRPSAKTFLISSLPLSRSSRANRYRPTGPDGEAGSDSPRISRASSRRKRSAWCGL